MTNQQVQPMGYKKEITSNVKPYRGYEKDFTSRGAFFEEEDSKEILFILNVWPGMYDGEKWNTADDTDDESYAIHLIYRNQDHINIIFSSAYGTGSHLKNSFDFVKQAAEKFHLLNELVEKKYSEGFFEWYDKEDRPNWEEVQELYNSKPVDSRDGKTWEKTMTVSEAKELFDYLKIKVEFPS